MADLENGPHADEVPDLDETYPVHRVTLYLNGDEPSFEDFAKGDDVIAVQIQANVGERNVATGAMTLFDEKEEGDAESG